MRNPDPSKPQLMKKRYALSELLAECDQEVSPLPMIAEWEAMPDVGLEIVGDYVVSDVKGDQSAAVAPKAEPR